MSEETMNRRRLLYTTGVAGMVIAAGCNGRDDEPPNGEEDAQQGPVRVGPDAEHEYQPDETDLEVGDTLEFVWASDGHNVVVDEQPDDAEWEGVEELQDEGFEHEHTFEVTGTYEYYCSPHRDEGMTGQVEVSDEGERADADDEIGTDDPDDALYAQ